MLLQRKMIQMNLEARDLDYAFKIHEKNCKNIRDTNMCCNIAI